MKKFLDEFKKFISRGNVMDMAVGVVVGSAFTKIVTSLVNDVIMPVIGLLFGGIDFTTLRWIIVEADEEKGIEEAALNYGNFIQTVVDFLLVAFVIFLVVKGINKLRDMGKKKEEEAPAPAPAPEPSAEEKLLTEIRDLLKKDK